MGIQEIEGSGVQPQEPSFIKVQGREDLEKFLIVVQFPSLCLLYIVFWLFSKTFLIGDSTFLPFFNEFLNYYFDHLYNVLMHPHYYFNMFCITTLIIIPHECESHKEIIFQGGLDVWVPNVSWPVNISIDETFES